MNVCHSNVLKKDNRMYHSGLNTKSALASSRLSSVDFLKGFGIISFILWHCYDYYYLIGNTRPPLNRFILYTTGIFIFTSGFIVGYHYFEKFIISPHDVQYVITKRLYIRAVKLVCYVYIVNLISIIIKTKNLSIYALEKTVTLIISLFYLDRWDISIQVLIVIALGLAISPIILYAYARYKGLVSKLIILLIMALCLYDCINTGWLPYLWRYLPLSIIGIPFGNYFRKMGSRQKLEKYYYFYLFTFIGLCLISAVSSRCYEYILFETGPYLILVIAVFLSVTITAFKFIDEQRTSPLLINKVISLLGQYSLMIYIVHLIIIRVVSEIIGHKRFESNACVILIALILLIISINIVYITSYVRKNTYVDKLYRFLFS